MRDLGQRAELQRLIKMLIDVLDYPVHPLRVFRVAIAQDHEALRAFS